jgi:hypothetical protein
MERPFQVAVVDGNHAHAWHTIDDLIREPLPHKARANQADADGFALLFSSFERVINENHIEIKRVFI